MADSIVKTTEEGEIEFVFEAFVIERLSSARPSLDAILEPGKRMLGEQGARRGAKRRENPEV